MAQHGGSAQRVSTRVQRGGSARGFRTGVLCVCAVLLSACAGAPSPSGVITIAVLSSPNSFDPRVGTDEVSQKVYQLVYDNLLSEDGVPVGRVDGQDRQ